MRKKIVISLIQKTNLVGISIFVDRKIGQSHRYKPCEKHDENANNRRYVDLFLLYTAKFPVWIHLF